MKDFIFKGRLGRRHYFLSVLVLVIPAFIVTRIGWELGTIGGMVATGIVAFSRSILDAKRFRDTSVPGFVAPLFIAIFLLVWVPHTFEVISGIRSPYPTPGYLTLLYLFSVAISLYLLFARGDKGENKYGKPTQQISLKRALFGESYEKGAVFTFFPLRKGLLLIVGSVVLVSILLFGLDYWESQRNARWTCMERIGYHRDDNYYSLARLNGNGRKVFKTQEEALDYCLQEQEFASPRDEELSIEVATPPKSLYEDYKEQKSAYQILKEKIGAPVLLPEDVQVSR